MRANRVLELWTRREPAIKIKINFVLVETTSTDLIKTIVEHIQCCRETITGLDKKNSIIPVCV